MVLTIHHLHVSQSERLPWLCEELAIPYELKTYHRAPLLAPVDYKALHPAATAPIIQDGPLTLAESCACIEYICHRYAGGKLFLPPSHPGYSDFLYWWHWVDGTFAPSVTRSMMMRGAGVDQENQFMVMTKTRLRRGLEALEERFSTNEWLAGEVFTVADIMVVFLLSTFRYFEPFSLTEYASVVEFLGRVGKREAYQVAMRKCEPDMELLLGAEGPERSFMEMSK
ncbi:glutathione S-transferase [Aspergillus steynii IBT 23096]|uniref:Glutathione S-transferase n=1 Tax=Aspergillus steynii IBT 23096 TaxID=1392250 RepID=A0A2I2G0A8_9EURO|nr:glutathione S-transferase [Aspergillus steynii IBT 23096]PLB46266.1 glutathione S-transferase [Aspergillus steynii IBT 23096]